MKSSIKQVWADDDGILTFEWVLLVALRAIGVVGRIAAVHDAIIDELRDVAQAMLALHQSHRILHPLITEVRGTPQGGSNSLFSDATVFMDCSHNDIFDGHTGNPDLDFDEPS